MKMNCVRPSKTSMPDGINPGVILIPVYPYRTGTVRVSWARVDGAEAEEIGRYVWRLCKYGRYAERRSERVVAMHRQIAGLSKGDPRQVDHTNGLTLDNRRGNLRVVPGVAEQMQNLRSKPGSTSSYRGVTWHRSAGKWQASAMVGGKYHYLGIFADEHEAGSVASAFRRLHMPYSVEDVAS